MTHSTLETTISPRELIIMSAQQRAQGFAFRYFYRKGRTLNPDGPYDLFDLTPSRLIVRKIAWDYYINCARSSLLADSRPESVGESIGEAYIQAFVEAAFAWTPSDALA